MWWFQRVDDLPVWSISCFFVHRDYRRQGVMTQLIAAARANNALSQGMVSWILA
jgi:GNAT superfamily N-acetyltransferase